MGLKICLALDGLSAAEAAQLAWLLGYRVYAVKIHHLLDSYGPAIIAQLKHVNVNRVWVDHKLHDTPDTVFRRTRALVEKGADIVTVHASGGKTMMEKAVDAVRGRQAEIWAVTVLTSLDAREIGEICGQGPESAARELGRRARSAGVHGLVSSAQEVGALAHIPGFAGMRFVVPGVRSEGVHRGWHKRSGTPGQAIKDGASLIVVGSQVTKAEDPIAAFDALEAEVKAAETALAPS